MNEIKLSKSQNKFLTMYMHVHHQFLKINQKYIKIQLFPRIKFVSRCQENLHELLINNKLKRKFFMAKP